MRTLIGFMFAALLASFIAAPASAAPAAKKTYEQCVNEVRQLGVREPQPGSPLVKRCLGNKPVAVAPAVLERAKTVSAGDQVAHECYLEVHHAGVANPQMSGWRMQSCIARKNKR